MYRFRKTIVATVLLSLLAGGLLAAPQVLQTPQALIDPWSPFVENYVELPSTSAQPTAPSALDQLSTAFEQVADKIKPSVVSITSAKKLPAHRWDARPFQGHPVQDFFGPRLFDQFMRPQRPGPSRGEGYAQQGMGSGFVVNAEGHIITNHHVVRGADQVTVKLANGESFTAEVVGADPKTEPAATSLLGALAWSSRRWAA